MLEPKIVIRLLGEADLAVLERVSPDVFDAPISQRWAEEFLADARHHLVVALNGDVVVGFASAVHYVHPDAAPQLFINQVGVAPDLHRHGIATQLMQALFARGRELGCREAWLGTEHDNLAARGLYRALGGSEEDFVMVSFDLHDALETP
jgi:ribosomal protein S18 acetylase RimI-like enzyme